MGFKLTKRRDTPSAPVEITYFEDFPGGGTLNKTGLKDGDVFQKGTLVSFDESTRLVSVLKTAVIAEAAGADATSYKIKKLNNEQPHGFVRSDVIAAAVGGKSYAISADLDTSNADFDTLTVGTSLGALAVGDVIFHSAASGATAGALKVIPNGWLRVDADVDDNEFVAVGRRGTLYERRLPYAVPQAVKDALKGLIEFSQQR